jgi:hypothetical protein
MTSTIKVNNIQNQCGANIINENSDTITIGASGDTIALASGASQTGFGRTGTVNWQTSSIKTATFTAANGEGYFADTSSGAITMNLPAGTAGNIVSVVDYTNTFQTNNLTISPNGSQKIGGINADLDLITEGQSVTFVYVDDTEGWKNVQDSTSNVTGNPYIVATGGTVTESGNCKIHTFTGPGTFAVTCAALCAADNVVSYVIVAGGGGAGSFHGGGGGAGGFREVISPSSPYSGSPLNGYPSTPNRVTVSASPGSYPIVVGAGGVGKRGPSAPGGPNTPTSGADSSFGGITSAGGGKGGGDTSGANQVGTAGGSGGGGQNGVSGNPGGPAGGAGNTPPVSPAQGFAGGEGGSDDATFRGGGGGGGATAVGANVNPGASSDSSPDAVGPGGAGATSSINGTPTARAGGGGGGSTNAVSTGGAGGGGTGGTNPSPAQATSATANTGGGGGGSGNPCSAIAGSGGSGIVIIRYRFR